MRTREARIQRALMMLGWRLCPAYHGSGEGMSWVWMKFNLAFRRLAMQGDRTWHRDNVRAARMAAPYIRNPW